jgi:GntR family transcriptional regulator
MARAKWSEIYAILKERIVKEEYQPGQDFPTNLELSKEFNAHGMTIQSAVNALIREGLIISTSTRNPRRVRPVPHKSTRKSFSSDSKGRDFHKVILDLKIVTDEKDIPTEVLKEMKPPVLYYHHEQWLDGILAAVSRSYIPNNIDPNELKQRLSVEGAGLYRSMRAMGFQDAWCEETLSAVYPTPENNQDLRLPANSTVIVMNILRKVYDENNNLLEYCFLTDRADCYDFSYRFALNNKGVKAE